MKKYNKIMRLFTTALSELELLQEDNLKAENIMSTKKIDILAKAEAKALVLAEKVEDLAYERGTAEVTAKKIKEFLS